MAESISFENGAMDSRSIELKLVIVNNFLEQY
jgi:hypothetical protein